jgi:hypothetical protein
MFDVEELMKFFRLALVALFAPAAWSQNSGTAATQEQAGPTILSRADMELPPDGTTENHGGNYTNFFLFARGFYDTSAANYSGGSFGGYGAGSGWDAGGGVNLTHYFEHGIVALAYSGGYRDFTSNGNYSSGYQNLSFSFNQRLNKRWTLALRQSIQILPRGVVSAPPEFGISGPIGFNSAASQQQFFVTSASLVYQQTKRLSYEFGGDFFYAAYHPAAYFDSHGFGGTASINYRKTSRTTLGMGYTYNYFGYSGDFGRSNTNTLYGSLSQIISPKVQFGLSLGGSRTQFGEDFNLGGGLGLYHYERVSYAPFVNARLSRTQRNYSITIFLVNGVNAGNGTYSTSKALNFGAGFQYSLNRKFGLGAQAGYSRFTSIAGPITTAYGSDGYGFITGTLSYKFAKHVGATLGLSYTGSNGDKAVYATNNFFTITAGFTFTTEDRPVLTF